MTTNNLASVGFVAFVGKLSKKRVVLVVLFSVPFVWFLVRERCR